MPRRMDVLGVFEFRPYFCSTVTIPAIQLDTSAPSSLLVHFLRCRVAYRPVASALRLVFVPQTSYNRLHPLNKNNIPVTSKFPSFSSPQGDCLAPAAARLISLRFLYKNEHDVNKLTFISHMFLQLRFFLC